jgi:hypothetical protein
MVVTGRPVANSVHQHSKLRTPSVAYIEQTTEF